MGDFNVVHSDEARYRAHDGESQIGDNCFSNRFEAEFPRITELWQPSFTSGSTCERETLARLDNFYTGLRAPELCEFDITCKVWCSPHKEFCSDHVPALCRIDRRVNRLLGPKRIPVWTTRHPLFPATVAEEMRDLPEDASPWEALDLLKESFHIAADRVRAECKTSNDAPPHEKKHWSMIAVRNAQTRNWPAVSRALRAYPALCRYFPKRLADNDGWHTLHDCAESEVVAGSHEDIMYEELCEFVSSLSIEALEVIESEHAEATVKNGHANGNPDVKSQLSFDKKQLWRPTRKRLILHRVVADTGPTTRLEEAAEVLRQHWQPVFAKKTTDQHLAGSFSDHIQLAPTDIS